MGSCSSVSFCGWLWLAVAGCDSREGSSLLGGGPTVRPQAGLFCQTSAPGWASLGLLRGQLFASQSH